jgi:hypothetical protein
VYSEVPVKAPHSLLGSVWFFYGISAAGFIHSRL